MHNLELDLHCEEKTMSSMELVNIINDNREKGNAILSHNNFLKKVKKVLGSGEVKFYSSYISLQNKVLPCYRFPRRESNLMVMSENYKVQAIVYDLMIELESNKLSLEDMTLLVIKGQQHKIKELENKIERELPLTNFGKSIAKSSGTCLVGDWIKAINDSGDIKMGRTKAFRWLRGK